MNAHSLELIETKIAFLERANAELSDIVFRQHREIETLRAQIAALAARVEAAQSDARVRTPEEERPPHY
ncbi:MAG: SlyX family protein [Steroidobacteraceae bacterium]